MWKGRGVCNCGSRRLPPFLTGQHETLFLVKTPFTLTAIWSEEHVTVEVQMPHLSFLPLATSASQINKNMNNHWVWSETYGPQAHLFPVSYERHEIKCMRLQRNQKFNIEISKSVI